MKFSADLHTHSHYAQATSPSLSLETMYQWAQVKGIHILGTGDFTHPGWFAELKEKLEPAGNGFFRLKNPPKETALPGIKTTVIDVQFCLSTEISSVYTGKGRTRKNHNLVYAPDFTTAAAISKKLAVYADISLDGRPTVPLSSRDVFDIVLQSSDHAHLVPAHAWTPWFSTLGSKGGYDSIEECFRDLTPHIFAIETGLSSDPAMNWCWSKLDHLAMMSSSDAHSPQKLGREVNNFDTDIGYMPMFDAVKKQQGFLGTYEFFPEEGKYSYDGHRKCGICFSPEQTAEHGDKCPVCKKQLTIGVMNRVHALSDRSVSSKPVGAAGFEYIIPLPEILSEIEGVSVDSKKVIKVYTDVISGLGNEFSVLKEVPVENIRRFHPALGEAIHRMREGKVIRTPGYDGVYGKIKLFNENEQVKKKVAQMQLFI